jgi:hypothetical protein
VAVDGAGNVDLAGGNGESGHPNQSENFVARFLPDGTLDPAFGAGGLAHTGITGSLAGVGLAVDAAGHVYLAGQNDQTGHDDRLDHFVARFTGPVGFAGRVWLDADVDGLQDGGEPGLPDALVRLREVGGAPADVEFSGAAGEFVVGGASPGHYYLEVIPDAFGPYAFFTRYQVGSDPAIDSDVVPGLGETLFLPGAIAATVTGIDAGLVPGRILGDRVWHDLDGDGVQGAAEPGFAGAVVRLLDELGDLLAATATSPFGHYAFTDRPAGTYRIEVEAPAGYVFSPALQAAPGSDSDVDPLTGVTPPFAYATDFELTIDAGLWGETIFTDDVESGDLTAWGAVAGGGTVEADGEAAFAGDFGVQVVVAGACISDALVTVSGPVGTGVHEACEALTADAQIDAPAEVTFRAGRSIELENGFSIASGAGLTAELDAALPRGAFVEDDSPSAETRYAVRFHLDVGALTLGESEAFDHFVAYDAAGRAQLRLVLVRGASAGQVRLFVSAREDGGGFADTSGTPSFLAAGHRAVELEWRAGAGDGTVELWLDGAPQPGLSDLDNGAGTIDFVRWGAVAGVDPGTSGSLDMDEFDSRRAGPIGSATP